VLVRAPGVVVRRLAVRSLRVRRHPRRRVLELVLANLGNVTEELEPGRVTVTLRARDRTAARVRLERRELLPRSRAIVVGTYRGAARGPVVASVEIDGRVRRTFRIRL
jgi:hypothetical protein